MAVLVDTLRVGGAERIAVELACAVDPNRFAPFVIATRYGGPFEATLKDAGVGFTMLGRKRGFSPRKYWRAHRLIRGADLIYANSFGSNMWGALLARTARRPLVVRDPTFSGVRTLRRTYGYRRWIAPVVGRIICPSELLAQSLYDEGVPRPLVQVIVNGVRLDAALSRQEARAELGLGPEVYVVGIIAQLRIEKAHEVLLRAASRLRSEGRELQICVIGDGSRRSELVELAGELGLNGSVVWAGERRDAKRLASAFDVGVICSEWEGLPVAALEILAAGVPLVTTAVGVLPQILRDDAGIVVPVGDDDRLAAAIGALIDDPQRATALGACGRDRVSRQYGFERMVREFEAVFQDVADAGGHHA